MTAFETWLAEQAAAVECDLRGLSSTRHLAVYCIKEVGRPAQLAVGRAGMRLDAPGVNVTELDVGMPLHEVPYSHLRKALAVACAPLGVGL